MVLEVKELRKSFREKEVLKGVSFQAQYGEAFGFYGVTGPVKPLLYES